MSQFSYYSEFDLMIIIPYLGMYILSFGISSQKISKGETCVARQQKIIIPKVNNNYLDHFIKKINFLKINHLCIKIV